MLVIVDENLKDESLKDKYIANEVRKGLLKALEINNAIIISTKKRWNDWAKIYTPDSNTRVVIGKCRNIGDVVDITTSFSTNRGVFPDISLSEDGVKVYVNKILEKLGISPNKDRVAYL